MPKDIFSQISKYNIIQADPAPGKTALLFVDMQEYFQSIAKPIIENIVSLIEVSRRKEINVFYTRHGHSKENDGSVEDIIITGVLTNCCVETTARSAFDHDYRVFVVADACASTASELHTATLKNLAYGFAYIVDTEGMHRTLTM